LAWNLWLLGKRGGGATSNEVPEQPFKHSKPIDDWATGGPKREMWGHTKTTTGQPKTKIPPSLGG